jgi:hypothetical protein
LSIVGILTAVFIVANNRWYGSKDESLQVKDILHSKTWNIIAYYYGRENMLYLGDDTLRVSYPNGSFQDSGGFKFYSQPKGFPCESICLSYQVWFPVSFPWVKGGKLPGLWIGDMGANGGNHIENGYSIRYMWRSNGTGELYIYVPPNQLKEYYNMTVMNLDYGHSVWRGLFRFVANQWNNITLCVKLNKIGRYDGQIVSNVNGVMLNYTKMLWRTNMSQLVNGIMMHSFFGGNDPSWAPPFDTFILFRNFSTWQG